MTQCQIKSNSSPHITSRGLPGRKKKIEESHPSTKIKTNYQEGDNVTYFKLNVQGMIEGAQVNNCQFNSL